MPLERNMAYGEAGHLTLVYPQKVQRNTKKETK
jgi:hypothetical protein